MGNKIIRFFFLLTLVFSSILSEAQNENTTSPFSRYGIGELQPYSFGRFTGMGGASLGSRHQIQINNANPASYSSIDSLSFIFEFGMDSRFSDFKSNNNSFKTNDANFRYFTLNWTIKKWVAASMGLLPVSDRGYDIYYEEDVNGVGTVAHSYTGTGSLSKAYFGAGFDITPSLSLGANVYYLFGNLSQNNLVSFPDDNTHYNFHEIEKTRLHDLSYTLGLQYDVKLKNGNFLTIGTTLENKPRFTASHDLEQTKYLQYGGGVYADTISNVVGEKSYIEFPETFGLGLSYSLPDKLEVNADYYFSGWSKAKLFGKSISELTNRTRIALGAEYIPNAGALRGYLNRVSYRAGIHLDKTYLILNDHQIKEFGMSFGLGLPVNNSPSAINVAFEFGRRGTTKYDLIRENYAKISLYLKFFDNWFVKTKFN